MREAQKKTIDGIEFEVRPLAGMRAVTFLPRLNKVLGPALGALAATKGVADSKALQDALSVLGEKLDEKEMEYIARTLLAECTFQPADGSAGGVLMPRFDQVFAGQPETAFKLLAFALEVNYAGFIPALRALGLRAQGAPSTSKTPSPKAGPAGG